jgi:Pyruvate/2-oxoacid:ferredoxin oxidoreductase delta subunit
MLCEQHSGLHSLEIEFPPHDSSDAGSNPAEVIEFLRTEKFREQSPPGGTLSCLTHVVNLLHVKEPQAPRGPLSKIIGHFPSKVSIEALRWADHSFKESCWLWIRLDQETAKRRGRTRAVEPFKKKNKMWTCNLCTLSCNAKSTAQNQYKWTTKIIKTYWSV